MFEEGVNAAAMFGNFALSKLLPTVILIVVGVLAIHLIMTLVNKMLEKSRLEKAAHSLIKSVVKVVLYLLLGSIVAEKLGIDVTGVIALASVLTLAVSLAIQNVLGNLVGGFTLLYTKPFKTGDYVEIGGQGGTVQEISLTYTKLATADNKNISIPNSAVIAGQIVNYTALGTRRVDITVSASYSTPIELALEALREAGKVPTALDTPAPFAAVTGYGESAINYKLQVWCKSEDYWTTLFDANKNVKDVFDEKGVIMNYPHLNVHLDK